MKKPMLLIIFPILFIQASCTLTSNVSSRDISSLKIANSLENLTEDEVEIRDKQPLMCKKSKVPLFASKTILKMYLLTDMKEYLGPGRKHNNNNNIVSIIALQDEKETVHIEPVLVMKRGNSRGTSCEYKPIRLKFLDKELNEYIEQKVGKYNPNMDLKKYIASYSDELLKHLPSIKAEKYENIQSMVNDEKLELLSNKPTYGLFKKLGDDVKFVTHCGVSAWHAIGNGKFGDTEKGKKLALDRHQSESLWYDIINLVKMPTMKTRKVNIEYIDINTKKTILAHIGFFRENPSNIAKRCGLKNQLSKEEAQYTKSKRRANDVSGRLLHEIVTTTDYGISEGYDGHNVKHLFQVDDKNKIAYSAFVPYDFDLSALIVPEYRGDFEQKISVIARRVKDNFESHTLETYLFLREWVGKKNKILEEIENSNVSEKVREKFRYWYHKVIEGVLVHTFEEKYAEHLPEGFAEKTEASIKSLKAKINDKKQKLKAEKAIKR